MPRLKGYRTCFVPLCTNTTKKSPRKIFFMVPNNIDRRNKWFHAVHRVNTKSTSIFYCCEDHFDLKDDMENYVHYTLMGGKAKIKVDVVPHKFECQNNRKRQSNTIYRIIAEKRRKQEIIQEILWGSSENIEDSKKADDLNTDTINVEHIEVDFAPLKIASHKKINVETQTDIKIYINNYIFN